MAVSTHRRFPFLGALVAGALLLSVPGAQAQETVDSLRAEREQSRRDAAEAAAQLDSLSAEDSDLVEALTAIDAHIELQQTKIDAANDDIAAAERQAAEAEASAAEMDLEIEAIRDRLRELAIEAYVAPARDGLEELDSEDLVRTALRREYRDEIVGDEYELIDRLRAAVAQQSQAVAAAGELRREAESKRELLQERLDELDESHRQAEELRASVQGRISEWQEVSDEIAEADRRLAADIRRLEQEAEARRLAAEEEARRAAEAESRDQPGSEAADDDVAPAPAGEFSITHRPVSGAITSPFGNRVHPIFGTVRAHNGLDFGGSTGDPIVSATGGTVLFAGWRSGYGNTVIVSHGGGYTTLYAHMSETMASAGDSVAGGEQIGRVGSTGWSTGPHLHFEVRKDGVAQDPARFL